MEISSKEFVEFLNRNNIKNELWMLDDETLEEIKNHIITILQEQNMQLEDVIVTSGSENTVFIFNNKVLKISTLYWHDFPYIPEHPLIAQPIYKKIVKSGKKIRNKIFSKMMEFESSFYMMEFEKAEEPKEEIKLSEILEIKKELLSYGINWQDCKKANLMEKDGQLIIADTGFIKNMTFYKKNKRKLTWIERVFFGIQPIYKKTKRAIACYKKIYKEYESILADRRNNFHDRIHFSGESLPENYSDPELFFQLFKKIMPPDLQSFR